MRTAKVISISLTPEMQKEVIRIAKKERRSASEVMREAFRQYAALKALTEAQAFGKKVSNKKGIKPEDIEAIIDKGRR